MIKNIKPMGSIVFLTEIKKGKENNIILPEQEENKSTLVKAKIVAIGDGYYSHGEFVQTTLKVDDEVYFNRLDGEKIQFSLEDNEYWIINENKILCLKK